MVKSGNMIRKWHNILGLVFGLQILFWLISGLFFTLFPIDQIRGANLRVPVTHGQLAAGQVRVSASDAIEVLDPHVPVTSAQLEMFFGEPVWLLKFGPDTRMVSAITGEVRSPITPQMASRVAREGMVPKAGKAGKPWLLKDTPPREYKGPLPVYVVDYEPGSVRVYIDANTGKLVTVRSNLWRTFDIMWRFHIMDVTDKDEFDTWWLKLFAFFGLTLGLTGAVLVVRRMRAGKIFR